MKRTAERTGKGCFGSPFLLTISWRADDNAPAMHLFVALSIVTASMGAARPDVSVVPRPSVASFVAGAAEQVKRCYRSPRVSRAARRIQTRLLARYTSDGRLAGRLGRA